MIRESEITIYLQPKVDVEFIYWHWINELDFIIFQSVEGENHEKAVDLLKAAEGRLNKTLAQKA